MTLLTRMTWCFACFLGLAVGLAGCGDAGQDDAETETAAGGSDDGDQQSGGQSSADEGTAKGGKVAGDAGPAILTLAKHTHEFGTINESDTVECDIEFTNTGDSTLQITGIKPSCGCTTTTIEKWAYEPGERGIVNIIFKPNKADKPDTTTHKVVRLISNSKGEEGAIDVFAITAHVEPFVKFEPRMLLYGAQPLGVGHTTYLTVQTEMSFLDVLSVTGDSSYTTFRVLGPDEAARILPTGADLDSTKLIEVSIAASVPWGGHYFGIEVTSNIRNDAYEEGRTFTSTVRAGGQFFGEVSSKPDRFTKGARPGTRITLPLQLQRDNRGPFEVISATFLPEGTPVADVKVNLHRSSTWGFELTLRTTLGQNSIKGHVEVLTDIPGSEGRILIPVRILVPGQM